MTQPLDDAPLRRESPVRDPRATRDALALVLLVLGVVGLIIVLFIADPLAGAAGCCVALITAGILLGLDR